MRKLFLILVAMVFFAVPTSASAHQKSPFTASGNLCLVQLPNIRAVVLQPAGVLGLFSGEQLAGAITSSDGWEALEGAGIGITITNERTLFDFTTLTFSGNITGDLTVTTGGDLLTGRLEGTVSGTFLDPNDLLGSINSSIAQAKWQASSKTTLAKGDATATFTPGPSGTFCGPVNLAGAVSEG